MHIALRYLGPRTITVITNGKITGKATFLAGLTQQGLIDAALSLDIFHESINNQVVQAFHNLRRIQNVTLARRNPRFIIGANCSDDT